MMLTSTSPDRGRSPLTIGELREFGVPLKAAIGLSARPHAVQAWAVRRLNGYPRMSYARGLTVRVDKQDNVLSIDLA
jgi:hypothetical protein